MLLLAQSARIDLGLRSEEVRVLVEKRDFVAVAYWNFTFASPANEAVGHPEPFPCLRYRVAAILTSKGQVKVQ
jgi:hypothetical protein